MGTNRYSSPEEKRKEAERSKRRRRRLGYGTWVPWEDYVDADPVRDYLDKLHELNIGPKRISKVCGISHETIRKIRTGKPPVKRVKKETAEKIMNVDPNQINPFLVPRVGTIRRIHALEYMGHPVYIIMERVLQRNSRYRRHLHKNGVYMIADLAEKFKNYYEKHCFEMGPSKITKERARRKARGLQTPGQEWASPLAWDGVDMDDPDARPEGMRHKVKYRKEST